MSASKGAGRIHTKSSTGSASVAIATDHSRSKTSAKTKSAKTGAPGSATGVAAKDVSVATLWKKLAKNERARRLAAVARQVELRIELELEKRRSKKALEIARMLLERRKK